MTSAHKPRVYRMVPALLAGLCACVASSVHAAATCTATATATAFGVYNPLNASPTLANGSVSVTCTWTGGGTTTINVVSSYSAGNSGSYATRYMRSGANRLNYNLYYDAAFTQIRGDGSGGSQTGGATLTVSNADRTDSATSVVYGRIPAGQNAVPGSYLDTITMTVTY